MVSVTRPATAHHKKRLGGLPIGSPPKAFISWFPTVAVWSRMNAKVRLEFSYISLLFLNSFRSLLRACCCTALPLAIQAGFDSRRAGFTATPVAFEPIMVRQWIEYHLGTNNGVPRLHKRVSCLNAETENRREGRELARTVGFPS